MNVFGYLLKHSRLAVIVVAAIGAAALLWGRGLVGRADGQATRKELVASARSEQTGSIGSGEETVDLSQKQAGSIKVGTLGTRQFAILKTAVGKIDFNENMLVQVFTQYQGKIIKAFYNVYGDVKQGDIIEAFVTERVATEVFA